MRKRKNSEVSLPQNSPRGRPRANSAVSEAEDGVKTEFIVIREDGHSDLSEDESIDAGSVEPTGNDLLDPKELAILSDKGRINAIKYIEKYGEWLCCSGGRLFCIFCMKLDNPHKRMIFAKGGYNPQDLPDGFDVNCRQHPACVTHIQAIAPLKGNKSTSAPAKKKPRALPRPPTPETDGKLGDRYPRRVRKPSQALKDMVIEPDESGARPRKGSRNDSDDETEEDVYWKAQPISQRFKYNHMMDSDDSESDTETDDEPRVVHPLICHNKKEEEQQTDMMKHPYYYDDSSSDEEEYVPVVKPQEVRKVSNIKKKPLSEVKKVALPSRPDYDDLDAESAVAGLMLMASASASLYVH